MSACWGSGRRTGDDALRFENLEEELVVSRMPGLSGAERTTTVVIGTGLPGLAIATELRRRGVDSIIVSRLDSPGQPGFRKARAAAVRRRRGGVPPGAERNPPAPAQLRVEPQAGHPQRHSAVRWTRWTSGGGRRLTCTAGPCIPRTACCWPTTSSSPAAPTASCGACSRTSASPSGRTSSRPCTPSACTWWGWASSSRLRRRKCCARPRWWARPSRRRSTRTACRRC